MAWQNWFVTHPSGGKASFAETVAFNIWAHRTSSIETLIEELAAADDPNDETAQMVAFTKAGFLGVEDLTAAEIEYVQDEVAKRWVG